MDMTTSETEHVSDNGSQQGFGRHDKFEYDVLIN